MTKQPIVLLLLTILGFTSAIAQSYNRPQLEKERADILREIEEVKHTLNATKKNRREITAQLALLQRKSELREQAIRNISQQINVINTELNQSRTEVICLSQELDTLKQQYERSILATYKNRSSYDILNFIFSAANFNDALGRISYLKSYHEDREQRKGEILNRQQLLNQRFAELRMHSKERNLILVTQNSEKAQLAEEKKEKNAVAFKLTTREKELNRELDDKRKVDAKLRSAILKEIRKQENLSKPGLTITGKEVAKINTTKSKNSGAKPLGSLKAEAAEKLGNEFEKNRRKLPWPVEEGKVIVEFGLNHPDENSTFVHDNPGITIEAKAGNSVRVVFDGQVSAVFVVGEFIAVIVRHGKFLSTYSGLSSANVSKGQQVKLGQVLGTIAEKAGGLGELDFIITNNKNSNQNPRLWLR